MFEELAKLATNGTLTLGIAMEGDKMRVTVSQAAPATDVPSPITLTETPEVLDNEFISSLTGYKIAVGTLADQIAVQTKAAAEAAAANKPATTPATTGKKTGPAAGTDKRSATKAEDVPDLTAVPSPQSGISFEDLDTGTDVPAILDLPTPEQVEIARPLIPDIPTDIPAFAPVAVLPGGGDDEDYDL